MKLSHGQIRPGEVMEVGERGVIKASCSGLFSEVDEPDKLPPIYPWGLGNANSFSLPHVGDKIWVMSFSDNPMELFYFRKDDKNSNLNDILSQDYEEVEVVANKKSGFGWAQLYFTDGTGWILQNDSSFIQINKDGDIILSKDAKHKHISIDDNGISLGTVGGSAEPAVLGDKLTDCLDDLYNTLYTLKNSMQTNPYTMAVAESMALPLKKFKSSIGKITSQNVTLD